MAMFEKEGGRPEVSGGPGTVIGTNVKLVGALKDSNDITIHGLIEGEVASERNVTIGETAEVKGPISGATVSIAGVVRGSVEAHTRLEILATGKIFGDISVKDLIIRSGALFVGKCVMDDQAPHTRPAAGHVIPEKDLKKPQTASKAEYDVE